MTCFFFFLHFSQMQLSSNTLAKTIISKNCLFVLFFFMFKSLKPRESHTCTCECECLRECLSFMSFMFCFPSSDSSSSPRPSFGSLLPAVSSTQGAESGAISSSAGTNHAVSPTSASGGGSGTPGGTGGSAGSAGGGTTGGGGGTGSGTDQATAAMQAYQALGGQNASSFGMQNAGFYAQSQSAYGVLQQTYPMTDGE